VRVSEPYPRIVEACDDYTSVLPGEECGQVGCVTGVDEDGRPCPEVLQPLGRPGLRRLGLDRVLEKDRVDHVQSRSKGIVGLPLSPPGIQTERAVPLEETEGHSDNSGAAYDADPDPAVEGFHEGVDGGTSLLLRNEDGKGGVEVWVRKVDLPGPMLRDTEGRDGHVCQAPRQVLHHPIPRPVRLHRPVLVVRGDVQLDLELQIAGQLFEKHNRKALTAADVVQRSVVRDLLDEVLEDVIERVLVLSLDSEARYRGQTLTHVLLLHHKWFYDDSDHPQGPSSFGRRTGNRVPWPDDRRVVRSVVVQGPYDVPPL